MFWYEIESGFGEPGGAPLPRSPSPPEQESTAYYRLECFYAFRIWGLYSEGLRLLENHSCEEINKLMFGKMV